MTGEDRQVFHLHRGLLNQSMSAAAIHYCRLNLLVQLVGKQIGNL